MGSLSEGQQHKESSSGSELGDIDIDDEDEEEKIIEMRRKKREELMKVILSRLTISTYTFLLNFFRKQSLSTLFQCFSLSLPSIETILWYDER